MGPILCKGRCRHALLRPSGWLGQLRRWVAVPKGRVWLQPPVAVTAAGASAGLGCMCSVGLRKKMVWGEISINAEGFEFEKSLRRMELYGSWAVGTFSGCPSQGARPLQSKWVRSRGGLGSLLANLCLQLGGMERPLQKRLILLRFTFYLPSERLLTGVKLHSHFKTDTGAVLNSHWILWILFVSPLASSFRRCRF